MEKLSGFVLSVLTVCVISGIVIGVSPEGAMKKYINYIISLCVLAAIITPIISIFSSVPQYSEDIERIFEEHKETDTDAEAKLIEAQKAAVETARRGSSCQSRWVSERISQPRKKNSSMGAMTKAEPTSLTRARRG